MTASNRVLTDIHRLSATHEVEVVGDSVNVIHVVLHGPADTPYEGGVWRVRIELPEQYPTKSPSIGFLNPIFHPNIDFDSGSVCLDVVNQAWKPIFDLRNVFESFLPQLLSYPNGSDPLNKTAAKLLLRESTEPGCTEYTDEVVRNVRLYANPNKSGQVQNQANTPEDLELKTDEDNDSSLSDLSDLSELSE